VTTPAPPNPYAPPAAGLDTEAPRPLSAAEVDRLASRWQRLGGALFDGLLYFVATIPCYFGLPDGFASLKRPHSNPFVLFTSTGTWGLVGGVLVAALTIAHWTLLAKRGQTIGKIVAGTRVVRSDDARAGFLHAVVLRVWPVEIASRVPVLQFTTFVDVLFIFGASRRCLHDRIAGTKVVKVGRGSAQ